MRRKRPKRPILRSMLAAQRNRAGTTMTQQYVRSSFIPQALPKAAPDAQGTICWFTETSKCCIYDGIAHVFCVTYPDVE